MQISGHYTGYLTGSIAASGTLSSEFDTSEWNMMGLIYSGMTNATLTAQVSHRSDLDPLGGAYQPLLGSNGVALVLCGPTGAAGAISGVVLEPLRPYRFVKFAAVTQAGEVSLRMPVKA
jgi:hypothetical protein